MQKSSILCEVLPELAKSFSSVRTLALLQRTCHTLCGSIKNYNDLYREVLRSSAWVNKSQGKREFVLTHSDLHNILYLNSNYLTPYERVLNWSARGHLVQRETLFALALAKHGSLEGISQAFHLRKSRRRKAFFKALLSYSTRLLSPHAETTVTVEHPAEELLVGEIQGET
jgi:hypothetical protein